MIRNVFVAVCLSLAACATAPERSVQAAISEERFGPMAAAISNRVGTWRVEARLQLTPSARPVVIDAIAESRIIGGRWLVSELRSADGMNGFHGLGVNGFDPATGRYTGYWVDGSRGFSVPVEGVFDAATGVFRTTSQERRADGQIVTVVSETRTIGPDREETVFTAPDAEGRPYERMRLIYTRNGG